MPETLTCPACGYLRQPTDNAPPWQCPHCQKAYNKTARTVQRPIAPIIAEPVPVPPQPINFTGADLLNYDKFIGKLDEMDARLQQLVAREISDPLVLQTGWLPVNRTSANFRTHELKVSPGRLEFCATTSSRWFSITFMLLGVGEAVFISISNTKRGLFLSWNTAAVLLVSVLFVVAGAYSFKKGTAAIVFDLVRGELRKDKQATVKTISGEETPNTARLDQVHALQLLPVFNPRTGTGGRGYWSYELLLVLKDSQRISVVNHGDRVKLVQDAATLGRSLGKPVWDAIDLSMAFAKKITVVGRASNSRPNI